MSAPISILDAMDDPELFGAMFDAPSWRSWRVFLKALYGLSMACDELALYRHHTGRQKPPVIPARYATLVCGRRGGKTRILSFVASYIAAIPDHGPYLVPGETAVVAVLAADRNQAKVALGYIVGFLREIPLFADMIVDELAETVRLNNRVTIEVHTASIASPRGRTFLAVLADEIAFWPTGDSQNPDVEVINAVRPGLSTIPYSLLLVASSPYVKKGVLYQNYAKYFGKDDAPVLVWQGSTVEMNSSLTDDPLIAEMALEDPERAAAEHGAQFRTDIAAFITREAVEAVVARGMIELPPSRGISYTAFVDPSGGSADSMTIGVAHLEGETAVLDVIRERKPPFSPDDAVREFSELLRAYNITRVTGDAYAGLWPRERFEAHGIAYDVSERNKSTIYGEFLPALNGRRIRLLDQPRLIGQLVNLERRTARGGRDSVDHAPGAHDDIANAAAGALTQVLLDRRPHLVDQSRLVTPAGAGHAMPTKRDEPIVVVLCVGPDGKVGVVYAIRRGPGKMLILDVDLGFFGHDFIERAAARAIEINASIPLTSFAQTMHHAAARQGSNFGRVGPDQPLLFCSGLGRAAPALSFSGLNVRTVDIPPDELQMFVPAFANTGAIGLSALAIEKSKTLAIGGALDIRPGVDLKEDVLRAAAILSVAVTLPRAEYVRTTRRA